MGLLLPGSVAAPRTLRVSLPGPISTQLSSYGFQETSLARRNLGLRQQQLCLARGRGDGYRSYSNASDWAALFQNLAEMSKAFETASTEYSSGYAGQRPGRSTSNEDPIDAEAVDAELPVVVPVDVEEAAEGYSLYMDVPGLQKSDVKIQVFPQQRTITISGERRRPVSEPQQPSSGETFRRRHERRMGKFSRTLRLAKDLDIKTISARVEKGVLCVTAQKIPAVDPASDSMEINIE